MSPLPSQSRNQRWAGGSPGKNIPAPQSSKPMCESFRKKRDMILARDKYTCHICGESGNLIDFQASKCICRTCLSLIEASRS
jgi:hypothetical protein